MKSDILAILEALNAELGESLIAGDGDKLKAVLLKLSEAASTTLPSNSMLTSGSENSPATLHGIIHVLQSSLWELHFVIANREKNASKAVKQTYRYPLVFSKKKKWNGKPSRTFVQELAREHPIRDAIRKKFVETPKAGITSIADEIVCEFQIGLSQAFKLVKSEHARLEAKVSP